MEQFVLGFFQEQLSKVIVGFRKEQVNANLLNGKGEITDVSINCSMINENIRKISPLLEFEQIHVSRLGFHVTSWANLRKAPIVVDIGVVTVTIKEPMECLPKKLRRRLKIVTEQELVDLIANNIFKPLRGNGSYGFADRIVDNLTIEIETIRVHIQAWGKFKTTRKGPWTPPELQMTIDHLKIQAVDEYGHEATPEQVWAHNRMGMKNFMLYKKITGSVNAKLVDTMTEQEVNLVNRIQFENQLAVKRRLRDGAILGIQLDLTIPYVDIEFEEMDVPILGHWLTGLQYCMGKEKSFEDPLRGVNDDVDPTEKIQTPSIVGDFSSSAERDEDSVDYDSQDDRSLDDSADDFYSSDDKSDGSSAASQPEPGTADDQSSSQAPVRSNSEPSVARNQPRTIILLPNGLVIHESVCITCSIHSVVIRGIYPSSRSGNIQTSLKGCIAEFMWPKINNEPGVYIQASVSFLSMQEKWNQTVRTILLGGITHGDHMSLHEPHKVSRDIPADENFPMFERRSLRDDPLELRHTFPAQAIGTKTSIDIGLNQPDESDTPPMIIQEIGVDEFDIVLDADAWCRALGFFLNEHGGGFDSRWNTGDWTDLLTPDMLKDPSAVFNIDQHLHIADQMVLDENFMISSDRFNVTARFSNIELRVPAAVTENVRSCDILIQMKEAILVVSSALPRTFLKGKIGNSIDDGGTVDFPNDPTDTAYTLISTKDSSSQLSGTKSSNKMSTCGAQITVREFEVRTIPIIPFCDAIEAQQLISPMGVTMIAYLEGRPPPPEGHLTKIVLFLSIQLYNFGLNFDFDLLAGSTSTIVFQYDMTIKAINRISKLFSTSPNSRSAQQNDTMEGDSKNRRGITIDRQLSRIYETGGLGVVFCMQVSKASVTMWRQNVPLVSPFREPATVDAKEHDRIIRLLKLIEIQATEFEIGIEFDFQADSQRRTVAKCCLEEGRLLICNVNEALRLDASGSLGTSLDDALTDWSMVELVGFGKNKHPTNLNTTSGDTTQQMAIRLEEQIIESERSWSLSVVLNCEGVMNSYVEEVRDTVVQCLEQLLLPTWSKRELPPCENAPFPPGTIGALIHYLSTLIPSKASERPTSSKDDPKQSSIIDPSSDEPILERTLKVLYERFLPANLILVLVRIEVGNLLFVIPDTVTEGKHKSLGMHLIQTDLVVRFCPKPRTNHNPITDTLACKGMTWSSLVEAKGEEYYQALRSRQSLVSIENGVGGLNFEQLVHPFQVELSYFASDIHLSMGENLKISDTRKLESFTNSMKATGERCMQYQAEISLYLKMMNQSQNKVVREITVSTEPVTVGTGNESMGQQGESESIETTSRHDLEKARQMIQVARSELGYYEHDVRDGLRKNIERTQSLQRQVFVKEKERFAALALSFSRAAGWMRSGSEHSTGQRVTRKSTLWPHWVVLRKNLLILYQNPAEPRPVDIVKLDGSKIRQLLGGDNRQDTKRGFAIISSEGKTRYFIVPSYREFSRWVQVITETIKAYSTDIHETELGYEEETNGSEVNDKEYAGNEEGDLAEGDQEKPESGIRLGARFAGARNRIGTALENAKQKGKEMADSRHGRKTQNSSERDLVRGIQAPSENAQSAPAEMVEPPEPKRRIQLGNAFSGVKEATRSKLGAAIQNARQKIPDSSNGSSQQTPPRGFANVRSKLIGLSPGVPGLELRNQRVPSFGQVQGFDSQQERSCETSTVTTMSETDTEQASEAFGNSDDVETTGKLESMESNGFSDEITEGSVPNEGSRRGRFNAIGSAVLNATQTRLARRRVVSAANESMYDETPITVKRIHAGNLPPTNVTVEEEKMPLKVLEGNWSVSVKVKSRTSEDTLTPKDEGVEKEGAPNCDMVSSDRTASSEVQLTRLEDHDNTSIPEQEADLESPVFTIRSRRLDAVENSVIERPCGYESMFYLHSKISEGVGQLLYSGVAFGKTSVAGERMRFDFDLSDMVDSVMITGRALGGILESESVATSFELTVEYHAELLEHFINSILRCPLPIDVLLELSEFLGIPASKKEEAVADTTATDEVDIESFPSSDRPRRIHNILSTFENQLCSMEITKEPIVAADVTVSRPISDDIPVRMSSSSHSDINTRLYDPLLPPSVSKIMQETMHEALINVMHERDQAHSQLIASNVLHVHELEQERRKTQKLKIQQMVNDERGRLEQPNVASFFQNISDDRAKRGLQMRLDGIERMLASSYATDLIEASRQLAEEVEAKTAHALEAVRQKDIREIEKKNYDAETQALQEELRRVKALLADKTEKVEQLEKIVSAKQVSL